MLVYFKYIVFFVFLMMFLNSQITAQKVSDSQHNILLPDDFIISYIVPIHPTPFILKGYKYAIDSLTSDGEYPATDLACILTKRVLSMQSQAYEVNLNYHYYPYHLEENRNPMLTFEIENKIQYAWGLNQLKIRCNCPSDFTSFEFIEKWIFNPADITFTKKVIALNPIRTWADTLKKRTFFYFNKPDHEQNYQDSIPILKIAYEFYLDSDYCLQQKMNYANGGIPFFNSFQIWSKLSWYSLIDLLITNVLNEQKSAYDFYTNQKLNTEEIKLKLGKHIYSSQNILKNLNLNSSLFEDSYDIKNFKSILFMEEWYLTSDGEFFKKVLAISPVYYEIPPDDKDFIKHMTFWVYL